MKYESFLKKSHKESSENLLPKKKSAKEFDRYFYYTKAVQSPDTDVEFFLKVFRSHSTRAPITLIEDFCGTFRISCEWVKLNASHRAIGIDLDTDPLIYGIQNYYSELSDSEKSRLDLINGSVLEKQLLKADIVAASNFSYYLFKSRESLRDYFKSARQRLNPESIFMLDCFGGSACGSPVEEETDHGDFQYFWDQKTFDPVTNEAEFAIHFKRKGERKRLDVFTYDWRMWSIPELREILAEAGFKKTTVYWEGTDKNGEGDGVFSPSEKGEACESWIAYIVAEN